MLVFRERTETISGGREMILNKMEIEIKEANISDFKDERRLLATQKYKQLKILQIKKNQNKRQYSMYRIYSILSFRSEHPIF